MKKFRACLNKKFVLQTDNMAVSYILQQNKLQGQLARWSVRLQEIVKNHKLKKGILYYQKSATAKLKLIEPQSMRQLIVKYFHDQLMFAHLDIEKPLNRIQKDFVWENMLSFVKSFVRSCVECQKSKPAKTLKIGLMSSNVPKECNDVFFIDFIGPIVRSLVETLQFFLCLMGFQRLFVFFLPVRKQTSSVAIECLKNLVFSQHGLCRTIVSDNGTTFTSREFYSFLFNLRLKHRTISPNHTQSNNVEGTHRNIVTSLRIYHTAANNKWN